MFYVVFYNRFAVEVYLRTDTVIKLHNQGHVTVVVRLVGNVGNTVFLYPQKANVPPNAVTGHIGSPVPTEMALRLADK
jgi:hypothetical protein